MWPEVVTKPFHIQPNQDIGLTHVIGSYGNCMSAKKCIMKMQTICGQERTDKCTNFAINIPFSTHHDLLISSSIKNVYVMF